MKRDNATVPYSLTTSTDNIRAYESEKGAKIDNRNPGQRLFFLNLICFHLHKIRLFLQSL